MINDMIHRYSTDCDHKVLRTQWITQIGQASFSSIRGRPHTHHPDGCAESSLVGDGLNGLKAGVLNERTGIEAQRPTATERSGGAGSESQSIAGSCGGVQ